MNTGIIMVQHGDFPFDFKEKHKEIFMFVKQMLEGISKETRKIVRNPDDPIALIWRRLKIQ
jgi:hypothetical protein